MRSVLLCGGRGTRLSPQTEVTNKHLLPVYTKNGAIPMIWYPLNTLIQSGSKEILIISSQEHCGDIIEFLGDGKRFGDGVDFTYKIQDHNDVNRPVGIASAMNLIKGWVKEEPFAVILGDNFYENRFKNEFDDFENKYNERFVDNKTDAFAHIFLKEVSDPQRFGVATVDAVGNVIKIIEKPKKPESNLAVTGLYIYTPHVFKILPTLKVSQRGELEVSDINDWYCKRNNFLTSTTVNGFWSDLGTPQSMLYATEFIKNYDLSIR